MSTITVDDYLTDGTKRAKVDRLVAAAGLDLDLVFELIDLGGDCYRFGMYERDADGKIASTRLPDGDIEIVRRWVERWLP